MVSRPLEPTRALAANDTGDHLHPSEAGDLPSLLTRGPDDDD